GPFSPAAGTRVAAESRVRTGAREETAPELGFCRFPKRIIPEGERRQGMTGDPPPAPPQRVLGSVVVGGSVVREAGNPGPPSGQTFIIPRDRPRLPRPGGRDGRLRPGDLVEHAGFRRRNEAGRAVASPDRRARIGAVHPQGRGDRSARLSPDGHTVLSRALR